VVPTYSYYSGVYYSRQTDPYDMSDGPLFTKHKHKDYQINYTRNTSDFDMPNAIYALKVPTEY
jgi:hypothetical protein